MDVVIRVSRMKTSISVAVLVLELLLPSVVACHNNNFLNIGCIDSGRRFSV